MVHGCGEMWGSNGQKMGRKLAKWAEVWARERGEGTRAGEKRPKVGSAKGREVEKEPMSGGSAVREMDGTGPRGTGGGIFFAPTG